MAKPVVRLGAVQLAFFVMVAVILVRAAQVQLWAGAGYARQASEQRTEDLPQPARRGTIYDRNGEVLAESVELFEIRITPSEIDTSRSTEQLISLMVIIVLGICVCNACCSIFTSQCIRISCGKVFSGWCAPPVNSQSSGRRYATIHYCSVKNSGWSGPIICIIIGYGYCVVMGDLEYSSSIDCGNCLGSNKSAGIISSLC